MFKMRILISEAILMILSYTDIKKHTIDLRVLIAAVILAIGFKTELSVLGMIPGIVLIIFSKLIKDGIGSGDGYVFMVVGLLGGFYENAYMMMLAFLLAGLSASLYMFVSKEKMKCLGMKFPFIPYILISFNIVVLISKGMWNLKI